MRRVDGYAAKEYRRAAGDALLIFPAVFLGVLAMIWGGVSPALWGQQAAAWAAFALLVRPFSRVAGRIPPAAWTVLFLIALGATLLGEEVEGARRWLDLGIFHANAAMLLLPAMLALLCRMRCPYPLLLAAAAVLSFQPDISQLAAFSVAVIPILWNRRREWPLGMLSVLGLILLGIRCWSVPTAIEPVSYCEGILTMLGEISCVLQAAGMVSLAAVPVYFMYRFFERKQLQMLSLSVYYAAMMLFSFVGQYPILFMGFGLSPIAGYYLAYICGAEAERRTEETMG